MNGLSRLPLPLELGPRPRETRRKCVRQVVVARHGEHGRAERAEEPCRSLVLVPSAPVREIARGNDQFRPDPQDEGPQRLLDLRLLVCTDVQIGYMEEACRHDRMRL